MKILNTIIGLSLILSMACSDDTSVDPVEDNSFNSLVFESAHFSSFVKTENVIYGINSAAHKMTIYEPDGDSRNSRALIVLLSGGGFTSVDISKLAPLAKELVKYGFVVATAGYRTGDATRGVPYLTRVIEAGQDSKAAVRYMKEKASDWKIDPELILIGGWSAGAITALYHAYIVMDDIESEFVDIVNQEGGIEGSQGSPGFSSSVKGVVSLAGALRRANEVIEAGELPLYAIHGSDDTTIPNDINEDADGALVYASTPMVNHMKSLGIHAEVFVIANGDHGAPVNQPSQYIAELINFLRSIE